MLCTDIGQKKKPDNEISLISNKLNTSVGTLLSQNTKTVVSNCIAFTQRKYNIAMKRLFTQIKRHNSNRVLLWSWTVIGKSRKMLSKNRQIKLIMLTQGEKNINDRN